MKKKYFIITIDTEGDNLWGWKEGTEIGTNNARYLPRFQSLCNEFGFKPTWLTNWEMLQNQEYIEFAKREQAAGHCEIGMHLHAWNNPPFYELPRDEKSGKPYLIEYPVEIMEAKVKSITELFLNIFGFAPVSHRAGRWAINDEYFRLLYKYGYRIDCSITPLISWESSMGRTPGLRDRITPKRGRMFITDMEYWKSRSLFFRLRKRKLHGYARATEIWKICCG